MEIKERDWAVIERGNTAKRLLDNADYKDMIETLQADLYKQFRKTNVAAVEDREDLHKVIYAVDLLEVRLQKYVDAGLYEFKSTEPKSTDTE